MSWRDRLKAGSFRGAPFELLSATRRGGRRTALHEYPTADQVDVEDLGRAPRRFSLKMVLLGDDYQAKRDRLIEALETPGSGTLVHPIYGELKVAIDGDFDETDDLTRMSVVTASFVRVDEPAFPIALPDTSALSKAASALALAEAVNDFVDTLSISDATSFVASAAATAVANVTGSINAVRKGLNAPANLVASLKKDLELLDASVTSLLNTPGELASSITDLFASLGTTARNVSDATPRRSDVVAETNNARGALNVFRRLFHAGDDLPAIAATTPQRIRQARNQQAIVALAQRTAVALACEASAEVAFESADDAQEVLAALVDALDGLIEATSIDADGNEVPVPDALFAALVDLRAQVSRDLITRGAELPRLIDVTLSATAAAATLAYQFHGDAERADEIVARNRVSNPLFVPGGETIQVLSNA